MKAELIVAALSTVSWSKVLFISLGASSFILFLTAVL